MTAEDPEWDSGDPQTWMTHYQGWYQIVGAKPVLVDGYARDERTAKAKANEAMTEALTKVVELGLHVEAHVWTVKEQSRHQTRRFEPVHADPVVTGDWYGRFTIVSKNNYETNGPETFVP